jgi:hypothetical protein
MRSSIRGALAGVVAIFALFVFGSAPAFAQGIGVGVKVGPTFNDFTSDDAPEGQTGWMGGLFIGGNRAGRVGAAVEFNYVKKSAEFTFEDGSKSTADLKYIQIPVLFRFNGGARTIDRGVHFYGIVGPFFNFKVDAEAGFDDAFDDSVEDIDSGILVGGGIEITRFIVEFRYDFGLRRINTVDDDFVTEVKSNTAAILFGFRFN